MNTIQQLIQHILRAMFALFFCALISSACLVSGCKSQATPSQEVDIQAEIERANREWREQHGDIPPNITDAQPAEAERFVAQLQQQFNQE